MFDRRGIDMVNEGGDPTLVAASVVLEDMTRFRNWRIRGGPPDVIEQLQNAGFRVTPDPEPTELGVCRHRPLIAHLWPCPMNVGGAQRFVLDMAVDQRKWADVAVIFRGDGPEPWINYLPRDHGIEFICVADEKAANDVFARLSPSLTWHHAPHFKFALAAAQKHSRFVIGTEHGYGGNTDPGRPSWVIPVIGDGAIHHGVDLTRYAPAQTQRKRRKSDPFRVGVLGRRTSEKLPMQFVEALGRFVVANPKIEWAFVGNSYVNEDAERVTAALSVMPHVSLSGTMDPNDVADWLRDLDCVVIPSTTESVCYVAVEAMASGVPVVARAVGGLPEIIGDAGVLVPGSDSELLDAVAVLSRSKAAQAQYAKMGRERAHAMFDIDFMRVQYDMRVFEMTRGEIRPPCDDTSASIVIPVFNTPAEWLKASVESARIATLEYIERCGGDVEIILVNDGSTDPDTLACINGLSDDVIVVHRDKRGGVGAALNDGIRAANSEIIVRHDADDTMDRERLVTQLRYMSDNPNVTITGAQMRMSDGSPAWKCEWTDTARAWDGQHRLNHPTVAFRREAALSVGGYGIFEHGPEDLVLWCRLDAGGAKFAVLPDVVTTYRCHEGQESRRPELVKKADQIRREWRERAAQ